MRRRGPKKPPTSAALGRIADALAAMPAAQRSAFEKDVLALERRAAYSGGKRGPKPKLGETMSAAVLVKMPPTLKAEMAEAAKRLGVGGIAEYVRELHRMHVHKERNG